MANRSNARERLGHALQPTSSSPFTKGTLCPDVVSRDAQVTGNVGLYWTCYHLSRMGRNAMPTARNARGVDILAYNRDCSRTVSIQVKTLSKKNPVPLGMSLDKIMGQFWVIVNNVLTSPMTYVLLPSEVK